MYMDNEYAGYPSNAGSVPIDNSVVAEVIDFYGSEIQNIVSGETYDILSSIADGDEEYTNAQAYLDALMGAVGSICAYLANL